MTGPLYLIDVLPISLLYRGTSSCIGIAQSSGFLLDYSTQGLRAVFIIHLLHPRQNSPFVYVTYGLPLNSSNSVRNESSSSNIHGDDVPHTEIQ